MTKADQIHLELEAFIRNAQVQALITKAEAEVIDRLKAGDANFSVSITPDQIPSVQFPPHAQLIRVYGAKAMNMGKVERHPNSFQTLFTLRGAGRTKVFTPSTEFVEKRYDNRYWSFVPENTWHQPVAGEEDWVGVTFHSARADELSDEYKT